MPGSSTAPRRFARARDVPLVAADVNPAALEAVGARGLIALPGSASVALATALAPLHALAGLTRVDVATYQAVSGSGRGAMDELAGETVAMLSGKQGERAGLWPADRLQCDSRRWMHWRLTAYRARSGVCGRRPAGCSICLRSPSMRRRCGFRYSSAIAWRFMPLSSALAGVADAMAVLQRGSGFERDRRRIRAAEFPTPATLAMAPDKVYVGRLRADLTRDRALNFWVVADNVRKCAAHNAVSVAQILVNRSQ